MRTRLHPLLSLSLLLGHHHLLPHVFFLLLLLLLLHHLLLHEGLWQGRFASACSFQRKRTARSRHLNRGLRRAFRKLTLKLVYCGCNGCCCWFQPTSTKFWLGCLLIDRTLYFSMPYPHLNTKTVSPKQVKRRRTFADRRQTGPSRSILPAVDVVWPLPLLTWRSLSGDRPPCFTSRSR
jgi:hypothetical protein